MGKIKISGLGCTLLDFVYNGIDFNGPGFQKYRSNKVGDGGLTPGQLVFLDELEKFAGKAFEEIIGEIAGERNPDASNIGGPAIVSIIHAAQLLQGEAEIRFVAPWVRTGWLKGYWTFFPVRRSAAWILYVRMREPLLPMCFQIRNLTLAAEKGHLSIIWVLQKNSGPKIFRPGSLKPISLHW